MLEAGDYALSQAWMGMRAIMAHSLERNAFDIASPYAPLIESLSAMILLEFTMPIMQYRALASVKGIYAA